MMQNDYITSFANPNYALNDDILNCNIISPLSDFSNVELVRRLESLTTGGESHTPTVAKISRSVSDVFGCKSTTIEHHVRRDNHTIVTAYMDSGALTPTSQMCENIVSPQVELQPYEENMIIDQSTEEDKENDDNDDDEEEEEDEDEEDEEKETGELLRSNCRKYTTGFLDFYRRMETEAAAAAAREEQIDEENRHASKDHANSPDSGIILDRGGDTEIQKTEVQRRRTQAVNRNAATTPPNALPAGWQLCEEAGSGAYYWHVSSGTIQREPPRQTDCPQRPLSYCSDMDTPSTPDFDSSGFTSMTDLEQAFGRHSMASGLNSKSLPLVLDDDDEERKKKKKSTASSSSTDAESSATISPVNASCESDASVPRESDSSNSATFCAPLLRFPVRSLGWKQVADVDMTPERSSKAVNRCIQELSLSSVGSGGGSRDLLHDSVGRWGDGKDLFVELDDRHMILVDPINSAVLHRQPIMTIKIWGVGRDNSRDFAYVSRESHGEQRRFICHVFRCECAARRLANALCQRCKHLMLERRSAAAATSMDATPFSATATVTARRPVDLPGLPNRVRRLCTSYGGAAAGGAPLFPTPMEEPCKLIACHYLGSVCVSRPGGLDTLNGAIATLARSVARADWLAVNVAVAPSTVTITKTSDPTQRVTECRVRFLSFMGISVESVKQCGFIVHTAQDQFLCHVFHCEPSAGSLCKTIEAACTLRYQKCLDAHGKVLDNLRVSTQPCGGSTIAGQAVTPNKRFSLKDGLVFMLSAVHRRKSRS